MSTVYNLDRTFHDVEDTDLTHFDLVLTTVNTIFRWTNINLSGTVHHIFVIFFEYEWNKVI